MIHRIIVILIVLFAAQVDLWGQQKPCEQYDVFRQLDFWIGNWKVENPDGTLAGHNKIEVILDGCVIQENWTGNGPNNGKSFNYYNFQTRKWHQQWVDNFGQTLEFEGEIKDDAVYYSGESTDMAGKKVFHKLTISKVDENHVKQLWEQSYNNEKWETAFEGKYIREIPITNAGIELEKKLDVYLQPFIENDLFSGVILMAKNGEIVLHKAFGNANENWKIPNTTKTKFRIASISKAFTKLAIRQLAEEGKIDPNAPLAKYLPDYPNGKKITIQHLVDHTSGIPHINDFPNYDQLAREPYSLTELITLFRDKSLEFEPGTKEAYSNSGYVLLAFLIEQVSGQQYGDYLQTNIFQPANMLHSGHESSGMVLENGAMGYTQNLYGKGLQKALYYDPSIKIGGGSLFSTAEDLFLFEKAFRAGKLCKSTKPLYNEGLFGKSPGFNASIWGNEEYFVSILSNNYFCPMKKMGRDLAMMIMAREYKSLEIKPIELPDPKLLAEFEGDYRIDDDLISIRHQEQALVLFENNDQARASRLIPISDHIFFDSYYLEKVIFKRNDKGKVDHFLWVGDESLKVEKLRPK